jgi:hypothetical protein
MKQIALLFLLFSSAWTNAQTKMINHKSHSGSRSNFSRSLSSSLFDKGESNFGMAPERHVRNSKLDSVILLSKKVAVMVTSESCHYEDYDGRNPSKPYLWSAGKDTVYEHEVFNSGKSVEEIKKILRSEYYFANSIDDVVFLGFDGKYVETKDKMKEETIIIPSEPVKMTEKKQKKERENSTPTKKPDSMFTLFLLSLLSVLFRGIL